MALPSFRSLFCTVARSSFPPDIRRPGRCEARTKDESLYLTMAGLALRRPRTIPYLLQAAWAFRARGWYRCAPFLPLPPASYMRWRLETAYGAADAKPSDDEMERYVLWTSRMRAEMTRGPVV